jgi:two-component system response regulator HydG
MHSCQDADAGGFDCWRRWRTADEDISQTPYLVDPQRLFEAVAVDLSGTCVLTCLEDVDMGADKSPVQQIYTHSPRMRRVMSMAERVALADTTVMIRGESGVGKERLAQHIHARSSRTRGRFVAVNCGAFTPTLLESELFGHKRGAFTGAVADRAGLVETADRGTLFLDEIGEMPLEMQAALLRVLQEREIRRVGDNLARAINVRVITATNRNLDADVQDHRFRQDLYYRLSVFVLHIPPLRDRPDDLRALANGLLCDMARRLGRDISGFSPSALKHILRYPWPGNVRELQNAMEYACVLATDSEIELKDLPPTVRDLSSATSPDERPIRPLKDIEREYILAAIAQTGGNRRLAAAKLKIGIATLQRKLTRYQRDEQTASTST